MSSTRDPKRLVDAATVLASPHKMASKSVQETRFFNTDADEDVGSLSGFNPLPVGAYVVAAKGTYRVERLRLNLLESQTLWIEVTQEQGNADISALPDK